MKWLDCLEYEFEYRLREIILEHGAPIAVTDPKVKRLFDNLAAVRRLKMEVPDGSRPETAFCSLLRRSPRSSGASF